MKRLSLSLVLLFTWGCGSGGSDTLNVYAASSLGELLEAYGSTSSTPLLVRAEATGLLAREITGGAPADLFLAADSRWLDHLEEGDLIHPGSRVSLAGNDLVVALASGAPQLNSFSDLRRVKSLALGEWTSVPAGRYAKQALEASGLWEELLPRCVFTRNVRAALALVEQGQTEAALVYASDLHVARKAQAGPRVPGELYGPVRIEGCVLRGSSRPEMGLALLRGLAASSLWVERGFTAAP